MKLIVCGGLRIDYVITVEGKVRLRQKGGNALYAAAGARLWIDEVALLARAGKNYPEEWLEDLTEKGFNAEGIVRVPGWQEMRTFYAYPDPRTRVDTNPREHFERVGHPLPDDLEDYEHSLVSQRNQTDNPLMLRAGDVPDFADDYDAAHIAPLGALAQKELATEFRTRGISQITLDPGEYDLTSENEAYFRETCAQVDVMLPSELEINILLGDIDVREAAEELANWGPGVVVVKQGPAGCLVYERDAGRFTKIPAYPTDVVDVTGAGDSFCGGFSVGLRRTDDPIQAAMMGTVSASFVIEDYGALSALGTPREDADARLEKMREMVSH